MLANQNPLVSTGIVPDPLAKNAPAIGSPAFIGLPSSNFRIAAWQERFVQAAADPVDKAKQLSESAENLLASFLNPLHEQLGSEVRKTAQELATMQMTRARIYQKAKAEATLQNLSNRETSMVNGTISDILAKFDSNTDSFKDKFKAAIKPKDTAEDMDDATARKTLESRLKAEQEKIKEQKAFEKEIVNAIEQESLYNARARWAARFRGFQSGEEGLKIQQLNDPLSTGKDTVSFKPGKESGKQFNLLNAFFSGTVDGTVYSIENGKHSFDPKDPAACRTFVACARAKNNGTTTKVSLKLGSGQEEMYAGPNNQQSPANSKLLREKALWFMATLKYGLEGVPDPKWTGEYIKAYYDEHGKLPALPPELNIDLEMPPVPIVNITNFTPSTEEEKEFKRWAGLREAMLYCEIKENEKRVEKGELSLEQCTTLNQKFDLLRQQAQPAEEIPRAAPAA